MNAIIGAAEAQAPDLIVGLVNNTSSLAFAATDQQFSSILQAASPGRRVQIRRFAVTAALDGYEPIDALWQQRLDGLIVTGAEPQAVSMTDEPTWTLFAKLVDWAADHTQAAIWSCLAAHAVVFRLDGLPRRRLASKLSGVFQCHRTATHALLDDAPPEWPVPHSRYNDLPREGLEREGYTILSSLADGSADAFIKPVRRSMFLMLQGHPEYDADTLLREYRRDAKRWLAGGERPAPPDHYFDCGTDTLLVGTADPATCLAAVERAPPIAPRWLGHSVRLYENWLAALGVMAEVGLSTP